MAYRCTYGNHGKCTACESDVLPYEHDHIHIFRGRGGRTDILCSNCWIKTICASVPVLAALNNIGLNAAKYEDTAKFIREHVVVGIDLQLDLAPPSAN